MKEEKEITIDLSKEFRKMLKNADGFLNEL